MPNMTKKHLLAAAAAGAVMLGATTLSAAPVASNATAFKAMHSHDVTQVRYRTHRTMRHQAARAQGWGQAGPLGWPFAAAAGAGTVAGALVGNTTAAVTGYPYGMTAYPYGAYDNAYGSYAYAPGAYGSFGIAPDIGHSYYNGFGPSAPASQDNCAVDAGYGRKDYSFC